MNALVPLHFGNCDVRMVFRDGEPWWVLADVGSVLGLSNASKLAGRLDDYQRADIPIRDTRSKQQRQMIVVNEAGVYVLTLNSRKQEAKAFARWLFTEVLPSIRKFGMYPPPPLADLIESDRWASPDLTIADRFREERLLWEERHGRPFAGSVPVFSKPVVAAIERGDGRVLPGNRLKVMVLAELDVLYILTGRRKFSSQERRLIDRTRQQLLN